MISFLMVDYCIIGAGVLGCAIGKNLLDVDPNADILIVEKFSGIGQGNTGRSNAAYRNIFDTVVNIQLSSSSIQYYKSMERKGEDFGRKEIGYLFLLSEEQYKQYTTPNLEYNDKAVSFFEFLDKQDILYELFDQTKLRNMFPELVLEPSSKIAELIQAQPIKYGFLGKQCGNFSPDLVVKHYFQHYKQLGGEIRLNTRVNRLILGKVDGEFNPDYIPKVWEDKEIKAIEVTTNEGKKEYIQAKKFILATGAWINELLDPLGVRSIIKAKKRQLFTIGDLGSFIHNSAFLEDQTIIPFTILPTGGVFIKPLENANSVVIGTSDVIGRRFEPTYIPNNNKSPVEMDDPQAEQEFYTYNILPVLQAYFPSTFDEFKLAKGSAGNYSYSIDKYPVVDKVDSLDNLYFAGGASGSGIMKADSIARICTALVMGEPKVELFSGDIMEVSRFGIKQRDLPDETLVL